MNERTSAGAFHDTKWREVVVMNDDSVVFISLKRQVVEKDCLAA